MNRIHNIREILTELNLDALYITHLPNIRYLSSFSGSSAYLIISKNKNYFFTDYRYKSQSAEEVKDFEIIVNFSPAESIQEVISAEGYKNIGFEAAHLTVHQLNQFNEKFTEINFTPVSDRIEMLTMVKTKDELDMIKKACEITDRVFDELLGIIKPGVKEKDISAEISYRHKLHGAEKDSFDPIVASGWRGALPHGAASDKIINSGEMVTLDFGCIYNGFCSDLTRTISVGTPSDEMKKIYSTVLNAQILAIEAAKENINTKQLDLIARNYIDNSGYKGKFGHGLGHGLGIEVHEIPSVSQRMDLNIPANTVVTIEPGIYIEGLGGVRIEDDILITENGYEILNKSPKELIII
ncbi:MAG: aminopeptidase P family protein [Ignavibacteria bacterium]|nr:aminopeptidase P family protein [Ignavibacteria bacterium]